MADEPTVLELRGITKRFPGVVANDQVDFDLRHGEVHALLGENGAGKSTLMNILYGLYTPDQGQILLEGRPIELGSTKSAIEHGIGMVHQHFMLIPVMSVAENIVLATEPRKDAVLLDYDAARKRVRELSQRYGLTVDPGARVDRISVGQQQRVEILRALYRGAEILILDEPTAVLTPQEAKGLFRVVRDLAAGGRTTIFLSHKLEEVLEISGTITVLRDGHVTGVVRAAESSTQELARLMVGRDVFLQFNRAPSRPADPVLELRGLSGAGLHDVTLSVSGGEIVGVAGVAGNGQTQLAELVAGLLPAERGSIAIGGRDVTRASVAERRDAGLAYIPEDRYHRGLAADATISENLLLGSHRRPPAANGRLLD